MPRLIANPGRRDEQVYELEAGRASIGRGRDAVVRINNKSLSRQHATLEIAEDGVAELRDVGSKNGTYVEGARIDEAREIRDGQHFSCGDVVFLYSTAEWSVPEPDSILEEISVEATRALVNDLLREGRKRKRPPGRETRLPTSAQGRLQVLLEVARLLSSPEPIDKQLEKILDLVFSILDVDRVAILLVDPKTGEFGEPEVESWRGGEPPEGAESYSQHILEYVRERKVAALFSDAAADPRLFGADSVQVHSVRSSMCAPMTAQDRFIGALYVDNLTVPAVFNGDDLELLSAFAAQAAIAIDNARLYARLQNEAVQRNTLLRFFSPATIKQLMKSPELTAQAIETEVTALFCDISDFTALSARMHPRDVVALLNRYFPVMTEIVFRHEGTLEKYIGDALLAVWGAPFRRDDDATRAVQAAIEMQRAARSFQARTGFPPLHIHIGINSGPVAAGNIGSDHYLQYATIGDATNLASRLCTVAKADEIAIGVPTLQRLGEDLPWEVGGPEYHKVKGREAEIPVYKLRWDD